jgi:PST family polysaccharide transporter
LTNYFTKEIDKLLIGVYTSAHALGLYDRSNKLAFKPTLTINMPLREVAVPALSRIVGEPERYRNAYLKFLQNVALITMPGMAFMIVTADWLIYILMGDQWVGATNIFILLGVAALLIPIGNTNGWLFVTQDRTKDMLVWGFIDGAIKVISVVIGIFWGVMGVAWAVAIRTYAQWPLQCWFIGRKGPVSQWDFYRALSMPGLASLLIIAVIYYYRKLSGVTSPVTGIIAALALAILTTVVSYAIFPAGRAVIKDLWQSVVLLFTREKEQTEEKS